MLIRGANCEKIIDISELPAIIKRHTTTDNGTI